MLSLTIVALATLRICLVIRAQSTEPAPLILPPSQYWEGNDGPWSTFHVRVGSNESLTRLLPSTAIPNTWVVLDEACHDISCADSRGGYPLFNPNQSTTWRRKGFFNLGYESNLNYSGNGLYGLDKVGLGLTASGALPALDDQVIAGFTTTDFQLGYLGLNPQPTNFTDFKDPVPSLLRTLRDRNLIPSLSYSYTAGNQYQLNKVFGSLVFGGFDSSRFKANDPTFSLGADTTRDLIVTLQSLQVTEPSGRTTELLDRSIVTYIDSTVAHVILPFHVCEAFERTFGLTFDEPTGLYLVSEAQHNSLLARRANLTFTLGWSASGGNTVAITLPYAAFDLSVSAPLVNGTQRYFPLKRASNDTQYTLGRAFLQEAYLTVDYDRGSFSVSQCVWPDGAQANVQPIHALDWVAPTPPASAPPSSLSIAAISGIVIGAAVAATATLLLGLARLRRTWPFRRPPRLDATDSATSFDEKKEADGRELRQVKISELAHDTEPRELLAGTARYDKELPGDEAAREVQGAPSEVFELPGTPSISATDKNAL